MPLSSWVNGLEVDFDEGKYGCVIQLCVMDDLIAGIYCIELGHLKAERISDTRQRCSSGYIRGRLAVVRHGQISLRSDALSLSVKLHQCDVSFFRQSR